MVQNFVGHAFVRNLHTEVSFGKASFDNFNLNANHISFMPKNSFPNFIF